MKTVNLRNLIILPMLIVLATTFACGAGGRDVYEVSTLAVNSFTDLILPDDIPVLKKKILVTPVINQAGITDAQAEEIRQNCISYLSKDEYLLITTSKKWGDNDSGSILKTYGTIINPEYADIAKKMGMDIVFSLVIHPLEITEKRTGIWPNRKDSFNVLISVSINALDTLNGTYIIYEDITSDKNFIKTDAMSRDKFTPDFNSLKSEISSMTKDLCSSAVEKLRKKTWHSRVNVDDGKLVINAGREIGINENTVFEIFKEGDLIDSLHDNKYHIFGDKIGESGVNSLSEDRAVLAGNIDLKDAAYVRVKRNND